MGIEYLEGIKPGNKIDLSKFEKRADKIESPETYLPALKKSLESLSNRLNSQFGNFVDPDGQITLSGQETEQDLALIEDKQNLWAKDLGKTKETMLSEREKNPANIAEVATTLLFDKVLNKEFIIVRASVYDDYENGADQLIIDKETGAVICGLDDAILGSSEKDTGEKKKLKIDKKMKSGGAKIKYGLTVNNSKLERKNLNHIPIFYFNLNKIEMNGILKSLSENESQLTTKEMNVYTKLINSLLDQFEKYSSDDSLHFDLKNNLNKFTPSLKKMQNYV
jgi:hypothetical protein